MIAISGVLLILVLAFAVVRPRGLPEAVPAVPAAIIVVSVGAVSGHEAWAEAVRLLPVVLFLAAILVVGDLLALLAWAALAAVLANLVNNLPAVLLVLPFAAATGPLAVLAVLIGVNVGPNLTYVGSLATLLWRRIASDHDHDIPIGEFTGLGLLTTPASIAAAVVGGSCPVPRRHRVAADGAARVDDPSAAEGRPTTLSVSPCGAGRGGRRAASRRAGCRASSSPRS